MTNFIVVKPSATYRLGKILSFIKARYTITRIYLIEKYTDINFGQSLSRFSDSNNSSALHEDDKWGFIIEVNVSHGTLNRFIMEINKDIFESSNNNLLCCPLNYSEAKRFTDVIRLQHGFNTCVFHKEFTVIKNV